MVFSFIIFIPVWLHPTIRKDSRTQLGFYDLVARLTPTNKDNTVLTFLSKLLNVIIPNLKKCGGVFYGNCELHELPMAERLAVVFFSSNNEKQYGWKTKDMLMVIR